ncbi:hypothetical protein SKAU_G00077640 [Synaphobranchus kaupii]|uniref:Ig-like domain-containing protein n=1 Tax=Synaphobranchus kaupii TaxID=118154 RepID=A0A9Q1G956_SYNKA|nr:hypothetical protein SKAU_G00077640 [Synaphobranchus kaupii]
MEINPNFAGRLTMNDETGALNISNLREEDSGEYDFSGIASALTIPPKKVQMQVYERIVSVQVISQVNNSTDSGSCNITLICSVNGGSQVALSWSRNGQNVAGAENRTTLTASPTLAEEIYVCTATNPISSQSNSVTVWPCRDISSSLKYPYIYIAAGGGGLLVVAMVVSNNAELMESSLAVTRHTRLAHVSSQSDTTQRPLRVVHLTDRLQNPGPEMLDRSSSFGVSAFSVRVKKY